MSRAHEVAAGLPGDDWLFASWGDGALVVRTGLSCEPGRWFTGYRATLRAWRTIICHPDVFPAFAPSFSETGAIEQHAKAVAAVDAALLAQLAGGEGRK